MDASTDRSFVVPTGDERIVRDASPEISQLANSIGFALAERGVQFAAEDAVAAAQRVFDQLIKQGQMERRPR